MAAAILLIAGFATLAAFAFAEVHSRTRYAGPVGRSKSPRPGETAAWLSAARHRRLRGRNLRLSSN